MRELVQTAETQMMKAEYYNDKFKNDPNSQRLVKDQADHWAPIIATKTQINDKAKEMQEEFEDAMEQERRDREDKRAQDMMTFMSNLLQQPQPPPGGSQINPGSQPNPQPIVQPPTGGSQINPGGQPNPQPIVPIQQQIQQPIVPIQQPPPGGLEGPPNQVAQIKTKDFTIAPFSGDRLLWIPFWQAYEASYHRKTDYTDGMKLACLKSLLRGDALDSVNAYDNINQNYQIFLNHLIEEFGDKNALIDEHVSRLNNLPTVKKNGDIAGLKQLYRTVTSNLKSLESLGEPPTSYEGMLGSKILQCIPGYLQKKWSEDNSNNSRSLTSVTKFLADQIASAERLQRIQGAPKPPQQPQTPQQPQAQHQQQQGRRPEGNPAPPSQVPAAQALAAGANPAGRGRGGFGSSYRGGGGFRGARGGSGVAGPPRDANNSTTRYPVAARWPSSFCKDIHYPSNCTLSMRAKQEIVQRDRLCKKCLRPHVGDCRNPKGGCRNCNKPDHHIM